MKTCKSTHLKQKMLRSEVVPFCIFMIPFYFSQSSHFSCMKDIMSLFSSETLSIERLLCRIHGVMEQDRRCRVIRVKSLHLLFSNSPLELLRFVSFWKLVTWKCTMCLPQEQWQRGAACRLYLGLSEKFVACPYYIEILREQRVESNFQQYERSVQIMDCFSALHKSVFHSHLCLLQQIR